MRFIHTVAPVVTGLAAGGVLATRVDVSAAIAVGALVTILTVRVATSVRDYALTGTLFTLGYAGVLWQLEIPTSSLAQVTLLALGALSLLFVGTKRLVKLLLQQSLQRYAPRETIGDLWEVGATLGSGIYLVWNLLQTSERIVRTVLVALGGPTSLVVNILESPGPFEVSGWVFNVSLVVFIVSVVLAFHTIDTWRRVLALRQGRLARKATERMTTGRGQ